MQDYEILLYYKYTDIADAIALRHEQRALCESLGLTGRIIVATEGINGTVEGLKENTQKYIDTMLADKRFEHTHFKRSAGNGKSFPKLSIKARPEIVSSYLSQQQVDPRKATARYIYADEFHKLLNSDEEFYVIDMRNDYEHRVGHFENSLLPAMKNFRDLPATVKPFEHLKNKKVVTVCTGGIRCEKASAYLLSVGFTNVYQLYGGIVTYMEAYPNQNFKGKLYVFDNRMVMGFNTNAPDHKIIANCDQCGKPWDNFIDCGYLHCASTHRHFICCPDCVQKREVFCSEDCKRKANAENAFYMGALRAYASSI